MKKYKVITDNFNWFGIERNGIIKHHGERKIIYKLGDHDVVFHEYKAFKIEECMKQKPEWFQEIKEDDLLELEEEIFELTFEYSLNTAKKCYIKGISMNGIIELFDDNSKLISVKTVNIAGEWITITNNVCILLKNNKQHFLELKEGMKVSLNFFEVINIDDNIDMSSFTRTPEYIYFESNNVFVDKNKIFTKEDMSNFAEYYRAVDFDRSKNMSDYINDWRKLNADK